MADYYALVSKAVGVLDPNTAEARRKIYDRARAALLSEIHKVVPAWERSEIMAEQLLLELAIGEVEAELQPLQCALPPLDARPASKPAPRTQKPPIASIDQSDCAPARDTWMSELLARASRGSDAVLQDFAPKRASKRIKLGHPERTRSQHRTQSAT
jgi:hypothetical protein